jgi:NADH:ubiquinone oxidoreductase subunit F (NADH-binding)
LITSTRLLPSQSVSSLDEYLDLGGCRALAKALSLPRREIVEVVKGSGLRGRGGGFPTGLKWEGLLQADGTTYLVCNGAEGERRHSKTAC